MSDLVKVWEANLIKMLNAEEATRMCRGGSVYCEGIPCSVCPFDNVDRLRAVMERLSLRLNTHKDE